MIQAGALLLAMASLTGCLPQRRGEPLVGPLQTLSAQEERGQTVYMVHCQQCHPGGESGLGPSLNDKPLPGFAIRLQVRAGLGAMPAFDPQEISDSDLDALVAYIVRLRLHGVDVRRR
ncbi:c-type cytochrome [Deinococcus peraridilitoris]|nr:cytochrome c [Deinococcus peraridilitoris]